MCIYIFVFCKWFNVAGYDPVLLRVIKVGAINGLFSENVQVRKSGSYVRAPDVYPQTGHKASGIREFTF
jgi:hypothetical protein